MSQSPFSRFPLFTSVLCLPFTPLLAEEDSPIVIENHMEMANEAGEIVAPAATTDEEAFLIRRISEFWKDGDHKIVKQQIVEFFDRYPDSPLKEYFLGILGDLYLQDNNPDLALEAYKQISSDAIYPKILINKLHCYYDLSRYKEIVDEGYAFLDKQGSEFSHRRSELTFLIAEGLFRQALELDDTDPGKTAAYETALPMYESLKSTSYREVANFALAESHRLLGNHEEGAAYYLELAERHPEQRDDLLFQAGNLQAKFDATTAIGTFSQVIDAGGERAAEATFNRLILLFKTEQYSSVLSDYEKVSSIVPEGYGPTFSYIVGKSFYALDQYQNATAPLSEYIATQSEPSDQLKNALFIQMICAQKLADEALYSTSLQAFESTFPEDPELPKALFFYATMQKDAGNIDVAKTQLEDIATRFPEYQMEEAFLFEYAYLAHQKEEWQQGYTTASTYLANFPESENAHAAWKLFFSSALHMIEQENGEYTKKEFYNDLAQVLSVPNLFSKQETTNYELLFAKTMSELGSHDEAYGYLAKILATLPEDENTEQAAEAHYLSAICLYEMQQDHLDFCAHLEKSLALDEATYDKGSTHVHLFNGYLIASGLGENAADQELVDKAATHLYVALSAGDTPIKSENVLWLANHHYMKVKDHVDGHWSAKIDSEEMSQHVARAQELLERELLEEGALKPISQESISHEPEALKLAHIYQLTGQNNARLSVVSDLLRQQSNEQLEWSYKKHALFELANCYKTLGESEKALETFGYITSLPSALPTVMGNQAALEVASIRFSLLKPEEKTEESTSVLTILNQLKDLQIRKNALSEPVHLQAALEYVTVRTELATEEERDERQTFFLKRFQEDFASQSDSIGHAYHSDLAAHADKKAVYTSYMKYVEGELLRLQAKQSKAQNNMAAAEEFSEQALASFEEVKSSTATPKDLYDRTQASIALVNTLNTY